MANNHSTLTGLFTNIADAIREKTGGTETIIADNFPEAIAAIDTQEDLDPELTTQDDLITQLTSALEGKAGVSGSAEVKTCTVTFSIKNASIENYAYTKHENGVTSLVKGSTNYNDDIIFENVVCGSIIWIYLFTPNGSFSSEESEGIIYIGSCCTDPCFYVEETATSCTVSIDGNSWQ